MKSKRLLIRSKQSLMRSKYTLLIYTAVIIGLLLSAIPRNFNLSSEQYATLPHNQMGNLHKVLNNNRYNEKKVTTLKINATNDFSISDWCDLAALNSLFPNLEHLIVTGGGVTEVPDYIFGKMFFEHLKCDLKSIHMADVHTIGQMAFLGCDSLEYIDFPNVLTVEDYAFEDCSSLKYINMPKVKNLYDLASFSGGYFEEPMPYREYLEMCLDAEFTDDFYYKTKESGWYSDFVYDPKVVPEFLRYMAIYYFYDDVPKDQGDFLEKWAETHEK